MSKNFLYTYYSVLIHWQRSFIDFSKTGEIYNAFYTSINGGYHSASNHWQRS